VADNLSLIRAYIEENILFGADASVTDETSLLDEGFIDSTNVLEIADFLAETFAFTVEDEELVPENFGAIASMAAYMERKLS